MVQDMYDKFARTAHHSGSSFRVKSGQLSLTNPNKLQRPKTHAGLAREWSDPNGHLRRVVTPVNISRSTTNGQHESTQIYDLTSSVSVKVTAEKTKRFIPTNNEENVLPGTDEKTLRFTSANLRGANLDTAIIFQDTNKTRTPKNKSKKPPESPVSMVIYREAVVSFVYNGPLDHHNHQVSGRWDLPEIKHLLDGRTASAMSRLTYTQEKMVESSCGYPVFYEHDITRSMSSPQVIPFVYQKMDFDTISENIPPFVRQDIKKNGRLSNETWILRLNYLRRRRQLGESGPLANRQSGDVHNPLARLPVEANT